MEPRPLELSTPLGPIAGLGFGAPGGQPAVALHGWLDNAASFARLAPLLAQRWQVVALDLAGHGRSGWRSADAAYNIWQDAGDVAAVARVLGCERFALVGHSRGATVAILTAATFPERVWALVLIDALMPDPVEAPEAPLQLRRAFDDHHRLLGAAPQLYPDRDAAVAARRRGRLGLSLEAAELLAERGLAHSARGFWWRADPRLKGASEVKLAEAQARAFLAGVRCPALALLAADHLEHHRRWFDANPALRVEAVTGPHHLHLEEPSWRQVGERIAQFLAAALP